MGQKRKKFIITLMGPSGCGKSYITERILALEQTMAQEGLEFHPVRQAKYVTRPYRSNEIKERLEGKELDVISLDKIPDKCELKYQTYGKRYGLSLSDLRNKLDVGQSPVVVINDIRVVEEMKRAFPDQVLSLFLFREIPRKESFEKEALKRGGGAAAELEERFNKATAIYRTYIENIALFDRVILNPTRKDEHAEDYAKMQVENLIRGVLQGKVKLSRKQNGKPKLFIIAGNAASGKDEIIKAVNEMGTLQATIIPKYTSRAQDEDDGNEMMCKEIPNPQKIKDFQDEYDLEFARHKEEAQKLLEKAGSIEEAKKLLEKAGALEKAGSNEEAQKLFEEAGAIIKGIAAAEERNLKEERAIKSAAERFWDAYKKAQGEIRTELCEWILAEAEDSHRLADMDLFSMDLEQLRELYLTDGYHVKNSLAYKELSADDDAWKRKYDEQRIVNLIEKETAVEHDICKAKLKDLKLPKLWELYAKPGYHDPNVDVEKLREKRDGELRSEFFVINTDYIDLEAIKQENPPKDDEKAYFLPHEEKGYVFYENNKTLYGFEVCSWPDEKGIRYQQMLDEGKHCVLVASLPRIFELVKKYFNGNIVTVFAYSEISSAEFEKHSKAGTVDKKMVGFEKEIEKYSKNIVVFDHVTIYAESELNKAPDARDEELYDQIFRLFRYYAPKTRKVAKVKPSDNQLQGVFGGDEDEK